LGYDWDDKPVGIGKKPDVTLVLCKRQSPFKSLGPSVGGYISGGTALGGMFSNPRRRPRLGESPIFDATWVNDSTG
jgi:hypothetical protein